jgi:hypothetical protein
LTPVDDRATCLIQVGQDSPDGDVTTMAMNLQNVRPRSTEDDILARKLARAPLTEGNPTDRLL